MNRSAQRGVALVVTLIMLSVVTFMTVAFLALSRRERASVTVTTDQATASRMADIAVAQAQAEIVSRILARSNAFQFDFLVSTSYYQPAGFSPGVAHPENVHYERRADGNMLTEIDRIQNIANLQYHARPPVYIRTNSNLSAPLDFRFYLDFNRNGWFETNGPGLELDAQGRPIAGLSNFFVGDPEWRGILERPELPHSSSNRFVGRLTYLVLPLGKALDFNYIHNQAKRPINPAADGFARNQGPGTWEINLAAFLRALNTNQWDYLYRPALNQVSGGAAFSNATDILRYRYTNDYRGLASVASLFGPMGAVEHALDFVDGYSDGPRQTNTFPLLIDNDMPDRPWPGSDNPRLYGDVQELLDPFKTSIDFTNRLMTTFNRVNRLTSYDRYTLYRLLAQMGLDSDPEWSDKIHLNYRNDPGFTPTNFAAWPPLAFFTNAADRLLRRQLGLSLTNIPLYPTNFYSAPVHQLLQMAANIYDATTNRVWNGSTNLPSVFRPVFMYDGTNVFISGYVEATNTFFTNTWLDLNLAAHRNLLVENNGVLRSNVNLFGVPVVIGAKKGYPNFNEFSLQTAVLVSRKLEVRKPAPIARPNQTNQLYVMGISNVFGLEAWNSYTQTYARPIILRVTNVFTLTLLTNGVPFNRWSNVVSMATNVPAGTWAGQDFRLPLHTNVITLSNAAYSARLGRFLPNTVFEVNTNYDVPQWELGITNRLQYVALDPASARVIDFVNLENLTAGIDITAELIGNQSMLGGGEPSQAGSFWLTNRLGGGLQGVTIGVLNQINESLGQSGATNNALWQEYSQDPVSGFTKEKAIELFRVFVGLGPRNPARYPLVQMQTELGNSTSRQAPYSPVRKLYMNSTWQVNDPLVHYTWEDLLDLERTNNIQYAIPPTSTPTNSNLGAVNRRYRPWGGNPNISSDTNAYNTALKDPMVRQSDDWDFPTNKFPNVGWLGRVHRGTPWQTVYLKSSVAESNAWFFWSINPLSHPTNDWRLFDLFTTAPHPNASRGQLSVNQTNLAAWAAVLGGVSVVSNAPASGFRSNVLTELFIEPDSDAVRTMVQDIMNARRMRPSGSFDAVGQVLAAPALSVASPYLNRGDANLPDAAVERIPQQIMSLLKLGEPRVAVYVFGQALRPADRSLVVAPGQPYHLLCTNYQITAEVAAKHVLRFEYGPVSTNVTRVQVIPERYQFLSNE